jgi:hypothetical protein
MNSHVEFPFLTEYDFAPLLPDHSRIWIYAADKIFDAHTAQSIQQKAKVFSSGWTAHQTPLSADAALLYNCFLVFAADETVAGVSGCSIDSSVRFVKELGKEFQADFFNRHLLYFLIQNQLRILSVSQAAEQYNSGLIMDETSIFNHWITDKKTLKEKWITPFCESPYCRLVGSVHQEFTLKL